jgi:hypothetical protein
VPRAALKFTGLNDDLDSEQMDTNGHRVAFLERCPSTACCAASLAGLFLAVVADCPPSLRGRGAPCPLQPVDEDIEANGETLVAVVDPDVLAERDQGREAIGGQRAEELVEPGSGGYVPDALLVGDRRAVQLTMAAPGLRYVLNLQEAA